MTADPTGYDHIHISDKKFSIRYLNDTKYIFVTGKDGSKKWRRYTGTIDDYEKINECEFCEGPILLRRGILFWSRPQHNKETYGFKRKFKNKTAWICYSCAIGGLKEALAERPKRPPDQWKGSYKLSDGGGGLRD